LTASDLPGPPSREPGFRPLPSGALLTAVLQGMDEEIDGVFRGMTEEDRRFLGHCKKLFKGWTWATVIAQQKAEEGDDGAEAFLARCRALDDRYGNPLPRLWFLTFVEAAERFRLVLDYLNRSGLASQKAAEGDVGLHYLDHDELGVSR
jgi:hypothetical protein